MIAKLKRYLETNFQNWQTHTIVMPGGTVSKLHESIVAYLKKYMISDIHVVVAAGICNLTTKVRHEGGMQIAYKNNTRLKVSNLLYGMHILVGDLNINYNLPVHVVCLPPAMLQKYAAFKKSRGKLTYSKFTES